jgi:hypothetical protein
MPAKQLSVWQQRWDGVECTLEGPSPFGLTDKGAQDYRGACGGDRSIAGASIADSDFTGADLHHLRLENCVFQRCDFDRADLTQLVTLTSQFEDCCFNKADLRAANIGFHGTHFRRCKFSGVRVTRINIINVSFTDVAFNGPEWRNTDFGVSAFWNCNFKGMVAGMTFRGEVAYPSQREMVGKLQQPGLHNVSFLDAQLRFVDFRDGCALEDVVMPADGSAFICSVVALKSAYGRRTDHPDEYDVFRKYLQIFYLGDLQSKMVISKHDLIEVGGSEIGTKIYLRLRNSIGE